MTSRSSGSSSDRPNSVDVRRSRYRRVLGAPRPAGRPWPCLPPHPATRPRTRRSRCRARRRTRPSRPPPGAAAVAPGRARRTRGQQHMGPDVREDGDVGQLGVGARHAEDVVDVAAHGRKPGRVGGRLRNRGAHPVRQCGGDGGEGLAGQPHRRVAAPAGNQHVDGSGHGHGRRVDPERAEEACERGRQVHDQRSPPPAATSQACCDSGRVEHRRFLAPRSTGGHGSIPDGWTSWWPGRSGWSPPR